jgi:hypothetical protein
MVVGKSIEARPTMYIALTYDHRLIDGREVRATSLRVFFIFASGSGGDCLLLCGYVLLPVMAERCTCKPAQRLIVDTVGKAVRR